MNFSATGITLAVIRRQLKDLHKKVDLIMSSVGETAKDKFEEAMVSLENDNFRSISCVLQKLTAFDFLQNSTLPAEMRRRNSKR